MFLKPPTAEGVDVNEFQEGLEGTPARSLSERGIEHVRERGGVFVEAVRVTRMPMIVTDATLPGNPITFVNPAVVQLSGYQPEARGKRNDVRLGGV